jgi:hypothetical protein
MIVMKGGAALTNRKGRDLTMKKLIAAGIILLILGLYIVVGTGTL